MATSYNGKITTSGSSEAIRLDKSFFKQHPEFKQKSKVKAQVIGPGMVLLSLDETAEPENHEEDPIIQAYLAFLSQDISNHPEQLKPFDEAEIQQIQELVAGVVVSDDDIIPDDVTI